MVEHDNLIKMLTLSFFKGRHCNLKAEEIKKMTWENQDLFLKQTIQTPLFKKYPSNRDFCVRFFKTLIQYLEPEQEVHDDMYIFLCNVMKTSENEFCYRHYVVRNDFKNIITIKETKNMVINGTTGLKTWEAGLMLSDWALCQKEIFSNKNVLELGSGVGFTGITIAKQCDIASMIMTDCHSDVLKTINNNIQINLSELCLKENIKSNIYISGRKSIGVMMLDWNDTEDLSLPFIPNIVIGADIVYDPSILQPLLNVLLMIHKINNNVDIYIASVIRNQDTFNEFLKNQKNLNVDSSSRKRKIKDTDDDYLKPAIKKRTTRASSKKTVIIKQELCNNSEDDEPKRKITKKQTQKQNDEDDKPKRKIIKKQTKKEVGANDDTDSHINLNNEYQNEVCNILWNDAEMLSNFERISPVLAQKFISLISEGCTLPFIARYRKEAVDHLMPDRLQDIYESYQNVIQFKKKVKSVLETLRKSKKLTPEIEQSILKTKNLSELDLVYGPLKSHSVSLAERARNLGLETYAVRALNGEYINLDSLCDDSEELSSVDKIESHITHIVADIMYKDTRVLQQMRTLKEETRFTLQSSRTKSSTKEKQEGDNRKLDSRSDPETYKLYFDWKCPVMFVKCYQTLAVNRGEEEKILSVKVIIPDWFYNKLERFCQTLWRSSHWVKKGLGDAYNRLIKPWLSRQVRSELTNAAQKEAVKTFTTNLEKYLLTEPIKNRNIAGLDPGFKAGCKVGVIDNTGMKLEACNIYPNFNCNYNDPAASQLRNLLKKHRVELIGLGNGTACRETESWLKKHYISDEIPVIIVPEQGASIYSISKEAQKEHPNMDPNLISALSIARRVLDPLGELIKVEPKNLGVGLYQHDIPPKMLESVLDATVEKVVSLVGVDINTASLAMLRRISGLNESRAKKIILYRQENGSFKTRAEILKVGGIGKITYQQCAGFLKVLGGSEPLDSTIVHPESYTVAKLFAKKIGVNIKDLTKPRFPEEVERKVATLDNVSMSKDLNTDISTLELIVNAFKQKTYEDNMITFCRPVYSVSVQAPDQLKKGTSLTGVVRNVVPFGCFVDCGVGDNGLIHTSKMGNATLKLGDRVAVTVISTPKPKKLQLKLDNILD
ncbi:uncharacterized protein YdcI-like [Nymphalis io]|uniref:uncharacterized protein YdcI-like n=1 Tax=Inachis io TaxID=171585 RepID=UPI00216996E2|nr:uncharacterized protein YdcI-like [Nymphalis io]